MTTGTIPANDGIDRDRAAHMLGRAGLAAIVVSQPENVYYLTGHWPTLARMGVADSSFAVLPRDPIAPVTLIAPQFAYYLTGADVGLAAGVELALVAGPDAALAFYADVAGEPNDAREAARRNAVHRAGGAHPSNATAVAHILGSLSPGSGAIGYDSIHTRLAIEALGIPNPAIFADDTLRHLRLIKTAREIALMRQASEANIAACLATATAMRSLGTIKAVRAAFNAEVARQGNIPGFLLVDGALAEAHDEVLVEGRAVLLDCVSSRARYHGDYGRTVFLGEPPRHIEAKVRAIGTAWDALRAELRPGLRFSDIRTRGRTLLAATGHDLNVPFNPHSVGLAHTEHPNRDLDGAPLELCLEPGMIVSVDCPLMEAGSSGTAHLEDLTLITAEGSEPIHETGGQIIVV